MIGYLIALIRKQLNSRHNHPQELFMTSQQIALCERLKRLGYSQGNRVRIYGQEFDLISDPITMQDELVFVDGVERRSGDVRRVRIPLPVVRMIHHDIRAA